MKHIPLSYGTLAVLEAIGIGLAFVLVVINICNVVAAFVPVHGG